MMRKFLLFIIFSIMCFTAQNAYATQLPSEIKDYIQKSAPNTKIRFDGLITLPDGTLYIPLLPALSPKEAKFGIKYTYPQNTSFSSKPEIVIFNNNYCLLRVLPTSDGKLTVSGLVNMPIEVRAGILPQDLLVPSGLVLPDSLVGILGNLEIPTRSNLKIKPPVEPRAAKKGGVVKAQPVARPALSMVSQPAPLKNKLFFITNIGSDKVFVMPSEMREIQYTLKLDNIPKVIAPVNNTYLLVLTTGKTYMDVVDIRNEEIAKQIDFGVEPNSIVISGDEKIAYISSDVGSSIFVVDIPTMTLVRQIKVKGKPENAALSFDETKIVYQDMNTSDIYTLSLEDKYENAFQGNIPNLSKLFMYSNQIFATVRTKDELRVLTYKPAIQPVKNNDEVDAQRLDNYYKRALFLCGPSNKAMIKHNQELKKIPPYLSYKTSQKPVDMICYKGKLYILCAKDNAVDIFDIVSGNFVKTVKLPTSGFSRIISQVGNSNLAIITNIVAKNYTVFDLDKQSAVMSVPVEINISSFTVLDNYSGNGKKL